MLLPDTSGAIRILVVLNRKHRSAIPILPVSPKNPWTCPCTLLLIVDFQQASDLSLSEIKQCRRRIKKSATKDKKEFISSHLQADFHGSSALQWRTARSIRPPFTTRPLNLCNIHAKLTSKHMRATTFAPNISLRRYGRHRMNWATSP